MNLKDKNILIISPESWGINYVSKHHYAIELSKKGNNVFFLNPPSSENSSIQFNSNLTIVNYTPLIRGTNRMPKAIRRLLNKIMIRKILKKNNIDRLDIVWSFDPFRFQDLSLFNAGLRIYHPVDVHASPREEEITRSAHIVLCTGTYIYERLVKFNSNIHNLGHGVSGIFLANKWEPVNRSRGIKACMMGNLQRKIDYPVLFNIIENNPEVSFTFIGPYSSSNLSSYEGFTVEIDQIRSYPNVTLYGSVSNEKIPYLLSGMDIFLIIYREDENPATRANPHKAMEYLGTGKVILSSWMEEYEQKPDLIEMVRNNSELPERFHDILMNLEAYNSEEKSRNRIEFARKNIYPEKIRKIEDILKKINTETP